MSVEVNSLFFSYDDKFNEKMNYVLNDVTFSYDKKDILAIIGKTGSGKSTLIQTLNGLEIPFSGRINVEDFFLDYTVKYKKDSSIDYRRMKKLHKKKIRNIIDLRKKVGVVFQFPEYQVFENTVFDDVSYGVKKFYPDIDCKDMVKDALSLVGIDESYYERSPFELSGGEKRRVALAGIIAFKPDYLILDEPTVGLDYQSQENLINILMKLKENNTGIIIVTHNMDFLLKYADRAIVLKDGKIIKNIDVVSLFSDFQFVKENSLDVPKVFQLALDLNKCGFNIDLYKVKDSYSLFEEVNRR